MRLGFLNRIGAALALPLLLLSTSADVFGPHPCAHHDGPVAPAAAPSSAHDHHQQSDSPPEEHEGACTCIGACVLSPSVPAVSSSVSTQLQTSTSRVPRLTTDLPELALQPRFLLPFSTAPPVIG